MKRFAAMAGVSRSWLYKQPELRAQVDLLRGQRPVGMDSRRDAQRATADSLRQQVQTCRDEITRLRADNEQLRHQLARRLGDDRVAAIAKRPF